MYDEIPPGESTAERFSFDESDEAAPHYPLQIRWNRGFAVLRSLHSRLETVDAAEVQAIFGSLIAGLERVTSDVGAGHD